VSELLAPQPPGTPRARPSAQSAPYWEGCAAGELRILRCRTCGQAHTDAPHRCWRCQGADLVWEASAGRGSLYSWTVVWRPQTPQFVVPYAVAIVSLDEGCHLVSAIVGCRPEDLAEGLRLVVEFHPSGDGAQLPYFRPEGPGSEAP
jgi:hypothetical protein